MNRQKEKYQGQKKMLKQNGITMSTEEKKEDEEQKEQQVIDFSKKRAKYTVKYFGSGLWGLATFAPKLIWNSSQLFISGVNERLRDDELDGSLVQRVRPPRFVNFDTEIEPYSERKAFALQKLNNINMNLYDSETINKIFSLELNDLILTQKRIICVSSQIASNQL